MIGLARSRLVVLSHWLALGGTLLAMAGCQSDGWQFARRDALGQVESKQLADAGGSTYLAAKMPVVRGQYSSDRGVSTPSFRSPTPSPATLPGGLPVTSSYPTTGSTGYASGSYASPSGTTTGSTVSNPAASGSPSIVYGANSAAPTTTSGGTATSGTGLLSGSPAPPAGTTAGPQPVQPSPALGTDVNAYPRMVPPVTGDAAGMGPYEPDYAPDMSVYPSGDPARDLDIWLKGEEAMTGRFMFSVGVNSDAGLMGSIIVDEQNFDWREWPNSWEDVRSGRAWRGDAQRFRLEASPGTVYHRYMVSWQEPYWLDSQVSLGLMGQYYTRNYLDWNEQWLGGRVALGYHFTPSLTGSMAFRGMKVTVFNPVTPAPAELTDAVGDNSLYGFQLQLAHDTRDSPFLATQGHLIEASIEQVVGTYQYPQFNLDLRQYFLLHERPDGSGRHVLSLSGRFGWTDSDTPIYEHYFAGGFTTIRGFDFRGASPRDNATGVFVGGETMLLASAEYLFPITADDMLRGVVFCDTGTVEPTLKDWTENYRVAPGFGLRITIPAMGPAPIALDFAFPISHEPGDRIENFSFWLGFLR